MGKWVDTNENTVAWGVPADPDYVKEFVERVEGAFRPDGGIQNIDIRFPGERLLADSVDDYAKLLAERPLQLNWELVHHAQCTVSIPSHDASATVVLTPGERRMRLALKPTKHPTGMPDELAFFASGLKQRFPEDFRIPLDLQPAAELDALHKQLSSLLEEKSKEFERLATDHGEKIEATETLLKTIEETYDQKLALQQPVTYWETVKKDYHARAKSRGQTMAILAVLAFAYVGGACGLLAWCFSDDKPPPAWLLGGMVFGFGLFLYLLRIAMRAYLSAKQQIEDADRRRVVVLTYLAMVRDSSVGPGERAMALQVLFAPTRFGLLADDAPPASAVESLRALLRR